MCRRLDFVRFHLLPLEPHCRGYLGSGTSPLRKRGISHGDNHKWKGTDTHKWQVHLRWQQYYRNGFHTQKDLDFRSRGVSNSEPEHIWANQEVTLCTFTGSLCVCYPIISKTVISSSGDLAFCQPNKRWKQRRIEREREKCPRKKNAHSLGFRTGEDFWTRSEVHVAGTPRQQQGQQNTFHVDTWQLGSAWFFPIFFMIPSLFFSLGFPPYNYRNLLLARKRDSCLDRRRSVASDSGRRDMFSMCEQSDKTLHWHVIRFVSRMSFFPWCFCFPAVVWKLGGQWAEESASQLRCVGKSQRHMVRWRLLRQISIHLWKARWNKQTICCAQTDDPLGGATKFRWTTNSP